MAVISTTTAAERRMAVWVAVFCAWAAVLCLAAPPRWQQGTEATAVTDAWADEFDLDGDKEWLGDAPISPSSIPQQSAEYEDYDDDDEEDNNEDANSSRQQQQSLDLEEEDEEQSQDVSEPHQSEFLFVPSRDNRLMLQDDDDDQNGPIKVRHTGKNTYPEVVDGDSSNDDDISNDSSHQFEFTIDNGDEDDEDDKENEVDDTNDFVLDDAPRSSKDDKTRDDDEDDEDDNFVSDGDSNNDPMFEAPEEDSQVIYGDHVFLY